MTTIFEIEENMKNLKAQKRIETNEINKLMKAVESYNEHERFINVLNECKTKFYNSFEEMITLTGYTNTRFKSSEWQVIYKLLKFTDKEFLITFIGWDNKIQEKCLADRKCCVCIEYYSKKKPIKEFNNCKHSVCIGCYDKLPKINNLKQCVMCRTFEKK